MFVAISFQRSAFSGGLKGRHTSQGLANGAGDRAQHACPRETFQRGLYRSRLSFLNAGRMLPAPRSRRRRDAHAADRCSGR
jgi:hypothetical protein